MKCYVICIMQSKPVAALVYSTSVSVSTRFNCLCSVEGKIQLVYYKFTSTESFPNASTKSQIHLLYENNISA